MIQVSKKLKKSSSASSKWTPPELHQTKANVVKPDASQKVSLTIKLTPEQRKEYRTYAAERDLQLNQLFEEMFEAYRRSHG